MGEPNDYGYAVLGGFLVSLGCSFHLYSKGRTTAFNSTIYSITTCDKPSLYWKITMICSMVLASGILWNSMHFNALDDTSAFFDSPITMVSGLNLFGFALSGFLVGFGAKLSNGCTSGHLFCGVPRRSGRSMIAVILYMITAFSVHTWKVEESLLDETDDVWVDDTNYVACVNVVMGISAVLIIILAIYFKFGKKIDEMFESILVSVVVGFLVAFGMIFGGLNRRSKVAAFLSFSDESLLVFFISVLVFNLLSFYYIIDKKHKSVIECPTNKITWRLVLGSIIFGAGWGLGCLCPGPAFILFMFMSPHISIIWLILLIFGQLSVILFEKCLDKLQEGSTEDKLLNRE